MSALTASLMSIFSCTEIVVNVFLEYTFFRALQPMDGGVTEVVGAAVVTLGIVIHPVVELISDWVKKMKQDNNQEDSVLLQ